MFLLGPLALLRLALGDLRAQVGAVWQIAKLVAAACAALGGAFLYLAARKVATRASAIVIALRFGLATDVWPMASQSALQQSFALPWLALGVMSWIHADEAARARVALRCGVYFGIAAAIRAPLVFYPVAVGGGLLWARWRMPRAQSYGRATATSLRWIAAYAADVAAPLAALLVYNSVVFASWAGFSSLQRTAATNAGDAWRTPVLDGLLGSLVSPGRGFFVYTPIAVFALYGVLASLRCAAWVWLRTLAVAALLNTLTYAKWSAWWGGWCYGPRLLIDILPAVCLLLAPVFAELRARRWLCGAFAVCLAASLFNAALGAFAYDLIGWEPA